MAGSEKSPRERLWGHKPIIGVLAQLPIGTCVKAEYVCDVVAYLRNSSERYCPIFGLYTFEEDGFSTKLNQAIEGVDSTLALGSERYLCVGKVIERLYRLYIGNGDFTAADIELFKAAAIVLTRYNDERQPNRPFVLDAGCSEAKTSTMLVVMGSLCERVVKKCRELAPRVDKATAKLLRGLAKDIRLVLKP